MITMPSPIFAYIGEFIGTMLLILLGDGVVANTVLAKTKGNALGAGWIVITSGWAVGVIVGVQASIFASGGVINPAVAIGLASLGLLSPLNAVGYIIAEIFGALVGAIIVYIAYLDHFKETNDPVLKLAVFSTVPQIRNIAKNLVTELIGTFVLMLGVLSIVIPVQATATSIIQYRLPPYLVSLLVGFLVWGIGLSLGGPTGYAINPARDLGPRIAHAILPIPGKGKSDWGYGLVVPIFEPIIGALLASLVWSLYIMPAY